MLNKEIPAILNASKPHGWVMEPEAKMLLRLAGLPVPQFYWAKDEEQCLVQAKEIGYPLVAKAVTVLNITVKNVRDRFDAAMRVPRKARHIGVWIVRVEVIQQQERVKFRHLMVAEHPI